MRRLLESGFLVSIHDGPRQSNLLRRLQSKALFRLTVWHVVLG